jgi:MFS family permease
VRDRPSPDAAGNPEGPEGPGGPGAAAGAPSKRVHRNVKLLGVNSLLTDISSESVNAVLPLYLFTQFGMSPLAFGTFDGLYQGTSAILRVFGGMFADRRQRHKEVAGVGYALSAATKVGLLASSTVAPTAGFLFLDRMGKGIRSAPRDALISLSSQPENLGRSFGVHRALDTIGALLGPILAFALLSFAPKAFDSVFVVSFCIALLGLGVLFFFVQNPPRERLDAARSRAALTKRPARELLANKAFRRILVAGALVSLVTMSDAFIYLIYQRRTDMESRFFPLLFVGTALAYLVLAVPLGRLSDRIGRAPVFIGGHVLLIGCYLVLRTSGSGLLTAVVMLGLLGTYYAATDGVLMAMASAVIPAELRSSGLAWLTTVIVGAKLAASMVFGRLWQWWTPGTAVSYFIVGMLVALPVAFFILFRPSTRPEVPAQ